MNSPIRLTIEQGAAHQNDDAQNAAAAEAPGSRRRVSAFDLVASTPWAIQPEMLATISAIAAREGEGVEAVEARLGRPLQNTRSVTMRGETAVIPVSGPVFRYANLMTEISGATSLDVLAKDFNAALSDPAVKSIVLNVDSPGGQANGIAEFAAMVRASSKPVVAYVGDTAASAAYWIASAAREVVMSKTAMVGSIGAVLSIDTEKSRKGVVEIVSSQSPNKRPDVSTDAGRAQFQTLLDTLAQVFIEDVAAHRGVTTDKVLADFGQGAMRIGADAVAAGMADRIGTFEEVIAGLAGKQQTQPATLKFQGVSAMNLEELRAAHPDLCAALVEEGRTAGATAERTRILGIEANSLPGHEALVAQFKADGATTPEMAAVAILKAERETCAGRADKLRADAPAPVAHAAAPVAAPTAEDTTRPVEDRAKAKWDADQSVRAEFGTFETYLAYAKAHDAGTVKILSK